MGKGLVGHETRRFRVAQWRMLLATMFCYLFFYTGRQTFGFAIPGIQEELGYSKWTLGWVSTALLWAYAVGQAVNGNLGDKFGGRRMMSLGAVISCGLNWVVSWGTSFTSLIVPWAANGYAQSMGWAPGSRVLSNWWSDRERGKVYGLYVFAAGMSSVLAFTTSSLILELELGWRWIFRLPVLLLLVGGVAYYLIVRDRPEELGFPPLTEAEDESASSVTSAGESGESSSQRYLHVLANVRFLLASVAIGFQNMARYGLLVWVPVHFLGEDWKDSDTKWISIALPIGMALGAMTSGWLSDRLFHSRRSPVIALFMTLAAISSLGMFFCPKDHPGGIAVLFLTGFFAYGPQSAFWALCPDLLGRARAGTGTGIMNTFAYVFAGLGEPLIGWIIETNDNTSLVFVVVAVACVCSALVALPVRR
ncbi:MAG TPA: MFS transporter [Pirellulaceae bacterium]|nr:MFS transporter [Pirellulaceae bacterium]